MWNIWALQIPKSEKCWEWYDGYHFGNRDVYCPWVSIDAPMESHWENSGSNAIVQDILEKSTATTKDQIEVLISGECIEKELFPELTYTDLDSSDTEIRQAYLWSVLFSTGYLLGVLQAEGNWIVKSNSESGIGYTDIQVKIPEEKIGCIIEVKYTEKGAYDTSCAKATKQIHDHGYEEELKKAGMQVIHEYGIACYPKNAK